MTTNIKCGRCGRRYEGAKDYDKWNATMSRGVMVGATCPVCQTTEEDAEAEINQATLDYGRDGLGRGIAWPKGTLPGI